MNVGASDACPLPIAVNLTQKAAYFTDGQTRAFIKIVDIYGEETEDPNEAAIGVVRVSDGLMMIDLLQFKVTKH